MSDQQDRLDELKRELSLTVQKTPGEFQIYTIMAEEIVKRIMPTVLAWHKEEVLRIIGLIEDPALHLGERPTEFTNIRNDLRREQRASLEAE